MSDEDYKELNSYLNDLCLDLFKSKDMENSFDDIFKMCNDFHRSYNKNYLKIKEENNNLTFEDVLKISREIIASMDIKYLPIFDNLLKSGQLDFDYDNKTPDSYCSFNLSPRYEDNGIINIKNDKIINIKRSFNYDDIRVLIHEFCHYLNSMKKRDVVSYVTTEFISIYFEFYANQFIAKFYNPNKEAFPFFKRLNNTYINTNRVYPYEALILSYKDFGDLNPTSYLDFNKYIYEDYTKESYDHETSTALKNFKSIDNLKSSIIESYYYLYATILAFNARKRTNRKDVLRLMEEASNPENKDLDIDELFTKYNIIISEDIEKGAIEEVEKYLSLFQDNIKRGK